MNVSNIISSLVEANKNKLVSNPITNNRFGQNRKNDANFDKLEEFKIFPKKKTSSTVEPNANKTALTGRSDAEEKSVDVGRHHLNGSEIPRHFANISINQQPI
jgi:hypothetical protein